MKEVSTSTQQFVDIENIKEGIVTLKSGSMRRILMVSGINFELKSEEEKNMIISSYQNFLNSLDFSIQMIIHSRRLNIDGYLSGLLERRDAEKNDLIREQIGEYVEFVKSFVQMNDIMSKTFFVAVPYESVALSEGSAKILDSIPFLGSKKNDKKQQDKSFEEKINQLDQRTDQIINGLGSIGLRAVPLNDEELIELFYNLYNPKPIEKKELQIAKE